MLIDDAGTRGDQAAGLRRLMGRSPVRVVALLDATPGDLATRLGSRLAEQGAPTLVMDVAGESVQQFPGSVVLPAQARTMIRADSLEALTWLCSADVRFVISLGDGQAGASAYATEAILTVDIAQPEQLAQALTTAYAAIKQWQARPSAPRCHVVMRGDAQAGQAMFSRLENVTSRFLGAGLRYLGAVPAAGGSAAVARNAEVAIARRLLALG